VSDRTNENGRDHGGRFAKGNPGGPGGPRKRSFELRRAAEEAVTPEHVQALIRKAIRLGLEGNIHAIRLVLERVTGRPAEAPQDAAPLGITLPALRAVEDCTRALDSITDGLCQGTIDRDSATVLIELVQTRIKAIELGELEQRLSNLEADAEATGMRGRPRRA